jgi:hypothetical protein
VTARRTCRPHSGRTCAATCGHSAIHRDAQVDDIDRQQEPVQIEVAAFAQASTAGVGSSDRNEGATLLLMCVLGLSMLVDRKILPEHFNEAFAGW